MFIYPWLQNGSSIYSAAAKSKTAILLNKHGNIEAFGSQAYEEYYASKDREEVYLFDGFKRAMLDLKGSVDKRIRAADGREMSLKLVVTKTLERVRESVIREIDHERQESTDPKAVIWVLLYPYGFNHVAIHLLRLAACEAGMASDPQADNLILCPEGEAGCLNVALENNIDPIREGAKLMVLDGGALTLLLSGYQVKSLSPFQVAQVMEPVGTDRGSAQMDKRFHAFLHKLLGRTSYEKLKKTAYFNSKLMPK